MTRAASPQKKNHGKKPGRKFTDLQNARRASRAAARLERVYARIRAGMAAEREFIAARQAERLRVPQRLHLNPDGSEPRCVSVSATVTRLDPHSYRLGGN